MKTRDNNKVVVIGLDGGTFEVVRRLAKRGDLPHLASLMACGTATDLTSTVPYVTPTAFASFMTGVNPGRHGLFDFTADCHRTYDTGPLVNSAHIRTKTLWEILSEVGRRMVLVTIPFTYPPTPVNGAMVSVSSFREGHLATYPPSLAQKMARDIGAYEERHYQEIHAPDGAPSQEFIADFIARCHYQTEKSKEAVCYLMKDGSWDLVMTVFVITDQLQHYFWRFMDKSHPAYEPEGAKRFGRVIDDGYRKVDQMIGEILQSVPEEAHVLVISDHGFGPLQHVFYTNRWLQEQGLLRLHAAARWGVRASPLGEAMERAGLGSISRRLPRAIRDIRVPVGGKPSEAPLEVIDWSRTRAYATRWGININLKGREPFGIVQAGRPYEGLVETIIGGLKKIKEPGGEGPLFDLVARKEEVYTGPYMEEGHDILCGSGASGTVLKKELFHPKIMRGITPADLGNGDHRREGMLVMKGPLVEAGANGAVPRVEDLAPTILYLMGLPVPDYMDGKVLVSAMKHGAVARRPVVLQEGASSDRPVQDPQTATGAGEDDERIRRQLRNLGYLD